MSDQISSQLRFAPQADAETVVSKQSYNTSISTVTWTAAQWTVDISSLTRTGALCCPDTGPRYTSGPCQPDSVSCSLVSTSYTIFLLLLPVSPFSQVSIPCSTTQIISRLPHSPLLSPLTDIGHWTSEWWDVLPDTSCLSLTMTQPQLDNGHKLSTRCSPPHSPLLPNLSQVSVRCETLLRFPAWGEAVTAMTVISSISTQSQPKHLMESLSIYRCLCLTQRLQDVRPRASSTPTSASHGTHCQGMAHQLNSTAPSSPEEAELPPPGPLARLLRPTFHLC